MRAHIAQLNNTRKALIAVWLRDGGNNDHLREAIDNIAAAIVSLGGEVAEVEGY